MKKFKTHSLLSLLIPIWGKIWRLCPIFWFIIISSLKIIFHFVLFFELFFRFIHHLVIFIYSVHIFVGKFRRIFQFFIKFLSLFIIDFSLNPFYSKQSLNEKKFYLFLCSQHSLGFTPTLCPPLSPCYLRNKII